VEVDASIITDVPRPSLEDAENDDWEMTREILEQRLAEEEPFCLGQISYVLSEEGVIAQVLRRDIAVEKKTDVLCVLKGSNDAFILRPSNDDGGPHKVVSACRPRTVIKPPYDKKFFSGRAVKSLGLI
jgi:hypothetical protein